MKLLVLSAGFEPAAEHKAAGNGVFPAKGQ